MLCCRDNKGGLYLGEIWTLTEGNRNIMDPTGWVAEKLEWFISYYLFADDDVSLLFCHVSFTVYILSPQLICYLN